jgi:putative ABC transport system permease protein
VRSVVAAAYLLRWLRAEAGLALLIVTLVGVTSFLFAAAPRVFNEVADAGLRHELSVAPAQRRGIELTSISHVAPFGDPVAVVERQAGTAFDRFPASVQSLVAERHLVATSARFTVIEPPRVPTHISLRYQDGIDDAIRFVNGRLPVSTGEVLPAATFGTPPAEPPPAEPPRLEIAISEDTARATGIEVGDVLESTLDGNDTLVGRGLARPVDVAFEVVGRFAISDPSAEVWFGDTRLRRPRIGGSDEEPILFPAALIARDAMAEVIGLGLPFQHSWRYLVDGSRLDAGQLETVLPDLRRMVRQYPSSPRASDPEALVLRTGLVPLMDQYLAERAASEAVLSVAAVGPLALAFGSIGMTAVLLVARRRSSVALARDRGASGRLIVGAQLLESTVLAGWAALIGLAIARALVPGRPSGLSAGLAVATGIGAILVLVAATWPAIRRRTVEPARQEPVSIRVSPRRLVLELTAVIVAVAGIGLLQRRGLAAGQTAEAARFDPFLAAVPVLTGFAVAMVAARLYPLPIRALGWLAARRRDLVPVLGLRNVGRRPSLAALPLLILLLAAGFGSFASVVMSSVERGQVESSWLAVGADYRIEATDGATLASLDVRGLPGVEATAAAFVEPSAAFETDRGSVGRIRLEAVAAADYAAVTAGSPVAATWPPAFDAPSPDGPVPAIASRVLPPGLRELVVGDSLEVRVGADDVVIQVVEQRSSYTGIPADLPFLIVPLEAVEDAIGGPLAPTTVFVRGSTGLHAGLAAAAVSAGDIATVHSREASFNDLHDAPLVAAVANGFRVALIVAAAYSALSVIAALALSAARRSQDLAFLRTLGVTARQAVGITVIEHGIPVVVALLPGIATGIIVAGLLESSLGLDAFVGASAPYRVHVDWAAIALVAGALMIVVAVAIGMSTWLARRARAIEALRLGDA